MRGTHLSSRAGGNESGREADRRDESRRREATIRSHFGNRRAGTWRARSRHMRSTFPKYNIMYSFVGRTSRAPLLCPPRRPGPNPPSGSRRQTRSLFPPLFICRAHGHRRASSPVGPVSSYSEQSDLFYRGCGALSLRTPPVAKFRSPRAAPHRDRVLDSYTIPHYAIVFLESN